MNAVQARQLSIKSKPKMIELMLTLQMPYINKLIKEAAKSGQFSIRTSIHLKENVQEDVVTCLIEHYEKLGYEVDICDFFNSKMVYISWDEQKK